MSPRAQQQRQNYEGPMPPAEDAGGNDELSRNVLGLIGAYRMGAALDAEDLFPKRSSAAASESARGTVSAS